MSLFYGQWGIPDFQGNLGLVPGAAALPGQPATYLQTDLVGWQ